MITDKITQSIAEAYKKMKEELVGGQKKLDINKNKRIDSQDLAILRSTKKQNPDQGVNEGHPANLEAIKRAAENPKNDRLKQRMVDRVNAAANRKKDDEKWQAELNKEETELNEGKIKTLHMHLGDLLDQHIDAFNRGKLGHDQFGDKVVKAHEIIAKAHELKPEHARKFVNDYVDSHLKEETELSEAYAVQGARMAKRHLPGWLSATRHVNGNITSLSLSRGKPTTVFDTEDEANAFVREVGDHLKSRPGHGWGPITVQKVKGKTKTNEEVELNEEKVVVKTSNVATLYKHPNDDHSIIRNRDGKQLHYGTKESAEKLWSDVYSRGMKKEETESLDEKAVSQAQQRFMGMVHATQKGDMKAPSPEVAKVAASIPKKAAKDYASTKLAGLPNHVGEEKENQKPKLPPHLIKLLREKVS